MIQLAIGNRNSIRHMDTPSEYHNVHVANMKPTWVLSAPGGPHVVPMNLAIKHI